MTILLDARTGMPVAALCATAVHVNGCVLVETLSRDVVTVSRRRLYRADGPEGRAAADVFRIMEQSRRALPAPR